MPFPKKGAERHPSKDMAGKIKIMVVAGIPQPTIAQILKISTETLHKFYKDVLEVGQDEISAMVTGQILRACQRGEEWALKFFAARRMAWTEKTALEVGGPNGGPIRNETITTSMTAQEAAEAYAATLRNSQ